MEFSSPQINNRHAENGRGISEATSDLASNASKRRKQLDTRGTTLHFFL